MIPYQRDYLVNPYTGGHNIGSAKTNLAVQKEKQEQFFTSFSESRWPSWERETGWKVLSQVRCKFLAFYFGKCLFLCKN